MAEGKYVLQFRIGYSSTWCHSLWTKQLNTGSKKKKSFFYSRCGWIKKCNLDIERVSSWNILITYRNKRTRDFIRTDLRSLRCALVSMIWFSHHNLSLSSWYTDPNWIQRTVDTWQCNSPEPPVHEKHTSQIGCFASIQMFIGTNVQLQLHML